MIDSIEILARLDFERKRLAYMGEHIEILPDVTRIRASDGSHHRVIYSALDVDNADDIIRREMKHHRQLGVGFEWKFYSHDSPPDLLDRLKRHGFEIGPLEGVLIVDLTMPNKWIAETDIGGVVRVDRLDQIGDFRRTAEDAFQKSYAFTSNELADGIRTGCTEHLGYIAYVDGEPASLGRLYTHPQSHFGGLYGGGTRPAFRGRGLYLAVVAARARDALARGARYLLVDALPTSCPILERLGFERITDTCPCDWQP